MGILRRNKKDDQAEILEEHQKLLEKEEREFKRQEAVRRQLQARLAALQVELDNLTRQGGTFADSHRS